LSINAAEFEAVVKTVGEEFSNSRRTLYLDANARVFLLPLDDIELTPQKPRASPTIAPESGAEFVASLDAREAIKPPLWWPRVVWGNVLLVVLPLLSALTWLSYRRLRRLALQRLVSNVPSLLRTLRLQGGTSALLPTLPLRRLARSLRERRLVHSLQLDVARTVEATMQSSGLFSPVFGTRVEPEYLVLIDRTSLADHQARLATQIVTDLTRSDVLIEQYEFDSDPSILRYASDARRVNRDGAPPLVAASALQVTTLEALHARTPAHRVILFCDAGIFFDGLTGVAHAWVENLTSWEECFVFTPEAPERWGRIEYVLERLGFHVIPLSSPGLMLFSQVLQSSTPWQGPHVASSATAQPFYKRMPSRWLERRAPALDIVHQLCDDLERALGPSGFLWLCACAAYPEIHWGLTMRLGVGLLGYGTEIERSLPLIARLVWFREAFMPDWLRASLLQRLMPPDAERVRSLLLEILASVAAEGDDSAVLQIATGSAPLEAQRLGWARLQPWFSQRLLRHCRTRVLMREAQPGSPLRDYVFMRYLLGKRIDALAPMAPHALLHALFPGVHAWVGWQPCLVILVSVLLSGVLIFVRPLVEPENTPFVPQGVTSVAWSPDGQHLATASADGTARIWEVASGRLLTTLEGHQRAVQAVAFSPDGQRLVTASADGTARIWEVASGRLLTALQGHTAEVDSVQFSSDGTRVATASRDKTAKVWDAQQGRLLASLAGHTDWVMSVAFSPDGTRVVTASADKTAKVWEVASGRLLTTLEGHQRAVQAVAFSPDGQRLASGSADGTIRLWDGATGQLLTTLEGHTAAVQSVAWSPNGQRLASGSRDGTVKLWSVRSQEKDKGPEPSSQPREPQPSIVPAREPEKPPQGSVAEQISTPQVSVGPGRVAKYKLTVQVIPADSTVKFENSKLEYRPGLELSPGRYDLVVSRVGYKPARKQVMISTADVTLDVALESAKKYKLTVQVIPPDSIIKFDNSKLDYRPGMELPPGRYELVVTREGYKTARRTVAVSKADAILTVYLEPDTYKLTVRATPADSTVKFENSKLEYRPGLELGPGRYDLVVSRVGYKPARKQVMISTADVTLDVTLEPDKK
jgi:dipeptidyl aminopeptidase/acylaminoacyl peptidase